MEKQFATIWESIADSIGDSPAVTQGTVTRTWTEYEQRASRLASALVDAGLQPQSKVGLYLYNSNEYLEAQFATFKFRGVPVNVNYRYLDEELLYLLDNSDAEALFFHSSLGDRVARVVDRLPKLKLLVEVSDDGEHHVVTAIPYTTLLADYDPMPRITRDEDDIYMLYTGGTTGMPKGVMYQMGSLVDGFVNGGLAFIGMTPPAEISQLGTTVRDAHASGIRPITIPGCPIMHGTGMWIGAMMPQSGGAHVVTLQKRSFDAHELFQVVQEKKATLAVVVGDSFVKPMIRALDEAIAKGTPYDASSLKMIASSGVMWTSEVKEALLDRIEHVVLLDAMGSSEGSMGTSISMKGLPPKTAKFAVAPTTKVFTDDDREVVPGSGEIGKVAAGGAVPLGYYKDPEKSSKTFRTINGVRYSFPGDMATVEADGSLTLLGRGSQVINSGGEKIFPEEVEEAVKRVEGVLDCLVVGIDDEKFGQAVTAVASLSPGAKVEEAAVIANVKTQLAGYKAPKRVIFVTQIPRAPNGKADYKTARDMAIAGLA
ncbi:MAG: AMP-binding protein [Ilumatobacteraceae bacterium]|jgi:3-oxocholest-4-en-26-oate---CoA ligase|nr:AMP-binding protein [Ilumatobacteraceae bacterium]MDP4703177.1 AMP-binding protein [Ilumatobacteraceae bacterium]